MEKVLLITIVFLAFKAEAQTSVLQLADSLYIHGNYTKAIKAYKSHKNQEEVYNKIAKACIAIGNYDEALINYENSLKTNPKDVLTLFEYGKLLTRVKKHKEALEVFYQLIDIDYKNPNYHYESGLVLQQLRDSTDQNRFHNAFDLDSTHQKSIFQIAKYHLKKQHFTTVDKFVDIGLSSYATNKKLISLKAQNYYWKKEYENAALWFEKLLSLNESSQFIHEKLRNCYMHQYEFEKAIKHGEKALEFDMMNTTNLFMLGELFERVEDFKNAEKHMLQALLLQDIPLDQEYVKLGFVYNRQKKYKEAIDAYKRAVDENPENEQAHFFLVNSKNEYYKDIDTRINLFEAFLKKFPKSKYNKMVEYKIKQLKEAQFLKEN